MNKPLINYYSSKRYGLDNPYKTPMTVPMTVPVSSTGSTTAMTQMNSDDFSEIKISPSPQLTEMEQDKKDCIVISFAFLFIIVFSGLIFWGLINVTSNSISKTITTTTTTEKDVIFIDDSTTELIYNYDNEYDDVESSKEVNDEGDDEDDDEDDDDDEDLSWLDKYKDKNGNVVISNVNNVLTNKGKGKDGIIFRRKLPIKDVQGDVRIENNKFK
jgi:hypothetical protein